MAKSEFRPTGRITAWTAAVAIATLAFAASPASAPAVPGKFWGVVPQEIPTAEEFQRLKRGGVDSIRIPVLWAGVQPTRNGPLTWSEVDALVGAAATAGIEVLPFLTGAPTWAVPANRRYGSPNFLPVRNGKQRSGWKNFARQAVLRYGPRGSFWAENPGVPTRPIRTWQVWNEQNFMYFVARPNPAEYGKLVKLSHAAIRGVDKGARIVLGGLFSRPGEARLKRRPRLAYFAADFLKELYKRTPGIKGKFHGIALHPYTGTFKRLGPYIEEARSVLKANRDAGKGLWLTELGWSSMPPTKKNSFAKGRGGQKAQLQGAFRLLRKNQRKWRVQRVYWFSVGDAKGACNFCDGSGLFADGFTPKPAWYAFTRFSGGRPN
ncbi:MAG TPA: glycosyl hydrolase [Solirubrobacterales bacterium]